MENIEELLGKTICLKTHPHLFRSFDRYKGSAPIAPPPSIDYSQFSASVQADILGNDTTKSVRVKVR